MERVNAVVSWGVGQLARSLRTFVIVVGSWGMFRRKAIKPVELAGEGVDWLYADLSRNASAEYARLFANELVQVMEDQQLRAPAVAQKSGVSHSAILSIIEGTSVPDLETMALLEHALNAELLPTPRVVRLLS